MKGKDQNVFCSDSDDEPGSDSQCDAAIPAAVAEPVSTGY